TTDPVKKSVEIFEIGPVVLVDTAGIDDAGELGRKRINKSLDAIKKV
ncbi:MAG TPA: [FeFe] hydrogenase H-cluster maturation GTPase HydF, partial [Porphyromonadaceae bacterium]|nr:[FeFe] hydrogenase H-cluster maturation GTPase HydF [Porphyromonadaceae bacterium]HBK93564.1 [FeFe] hydrogenase H-cluster maturation GTPase HydF [Porphyromonadaceae bacterium]